MVGARSANGVSYQRSWLAHIDDDLTTSDGVAGAEAIERRGGAPVCASLQSESQ